MKSCREAKEMISAYMDKELGMDDIKAFEEHIQSCDSCRQEYEDILYIADLCADSGEVELPENFKAELHSRLLQSEQGTAGGNKSFLNKKYISIITSIAAMLLLAVLFRGTLLDGCLPQGYGTKTDSAAMPKPESNAANTDIASKSAAVQYDKKSQTWENTTQAQNTCKVLEREDSVVKDKSTAKAASAKENTVITAGDRSVAKTDSTIVKTVSADKDGSAAEASSAENETAVKAGGGAVAGAASAAGKTVIARKNANITIACENTQEQVKKITELAEANGGEICQTLVTTGVCSIAATQETPKDSRLNFKVPYLQYDLFIASLIEYYGASNISNGQVVSNDETKTLEDMNKTLAELDAKIKDVESRNASEALEDLKKQKESLETQIEQIRFDNGFVFITVTVQ